MALCCLDKCETKRYIMERMAGSVHGAWGGTFFAPLSKNPILFASRGLRGESFKTRCCLSSCCRGTREDEVSPKAGLLITALVQFEKLMMTDLLALFFLLFFFRSTYYVDQDITQQPLQCTCHIHEWLRRQAARQERKKRRVCARVTESEA